MNQTSKRHTLLARWSRHEDDEIDQRPLDIGLITRLLRYTRPHAAKRNWLFLLVVLRSIQLPCLTWGIAAIIKGPIAASDMTGLWIGVAALTLLSLSTQVVLRYRQRLALELGECVVHDLRNDLFAHIQRMPLAFFHRTKVGRLISRMFSDVEDVRIGVQEVLFVSLVQLGQMIVAAGFMLWYDWKLFLLVSGLVPVLWAINHHFRRKLSAALRAVRDSFSRVTATLAESVNGIRLTQGYTRQDTNARLFGELIEDHAGYNLHAMRTQGLFIPILELNSQAFIAILLWVGGYQVLNPASHVDVGDLVGFFFMVSMFFSPISVLGNQYHQALTAMAGAERVFKLLDTPPDWVDPQDAVDVTTIEGRVEFDDVTFGYDPKRPVLHEINFTAEPGQTIALVGHTGGGKTSIINLVAKFYLATSGEVRIDGRPVNQITTTSLHRHVGVVLQQNFLFSTTVMENIRLGRPGASDAEVRAAVAKLDCLDVIENLPLGFDTPVGERGNSLSLGQRQIVCFARAMLADPKILVLDEATSSVDALTEARIQRALVKLVAGRTSFIVAHRLSTIRHADQVLVLDHGRIAERGTHDQLLAADGIYAVLHEHFALSGAA